MPPARRRIRSSPIEANVGAIAKQTSNVTRPGWKTAGDAGIPAANQISAPVAAIKHATAQPIHVTAVRPELLARGVTPPDAP